MPQRTGPSAPCLGCGAAIERTGGTAPIRHYCDRDCRPRCSIHECDEPTVSRGWCSFHYTRWKLAGDPLAPTTRRRPSPGALCAFERCDRPRRKLQWCVAHYSQTRAGRDVAPLILKSNSYACWACGKATGVDPGYRKFCSDRCKALWRSIGGPIPDVYVCIKCGRDVPCVNEQGRRIPKHTKMCARCRSDRRFVMNSGEVAQRDGTLCRLCLLPVDMHLRSPDPKCASVDHIVPRSKGGTDDPDNLQLAHLICNVRKGNRV